MGLGPETQALVGEIRALRQEIGGLLQGIHQTLRDSQRSHSPEATERIEVVERRLDNVESVVDRGFGVIADHLLPDLGRLMARKAAHED